MNMESIMGLVRHVLTFGGGFLVSAGALDAATLEVAVGAIITLAGIAWSVIVKRKAAE